MIIGVSGKANAGKSTFSKMLAKELQFNVDALATPVKSYTNYLFGWDHRCSDGVLKEQVIYTQACSIETLTKRITQVLDWIEIRVGEKFFAKGNSEYIEDFLEIFKAYENIPDGPGMYAQYAISPRKAYQLFGTEFGRDCIDNQLWLNYAPQNNVVWQDVRFEDEARWVKQTGGILIKIEAERETTKENKHVSEIGFDENFIDIFVENTGTLEELQQQAEVIGEVIKTILGDKHG